MSLWISRLFVELANRNDKVCLTLDLSNTNRDGPVRFRTEADIPDYQSCYFNSANDEQVYNEFVSEQIKNGFSNDDFHFKIIELKSKTNKDISFNANEELGQLNKNYIKRGRSRVNPTFGRGKSAIRLSGVSVDRRDRLSDFDEPSTFEESDRKSKKRAKSAFLLKR